MRRRNFDLALVSASLAAIAACLAVGVQQAMEGDMLVALIAIHAGSAVALFWFLATEGLRTFVKGRGAGSSR